MKRVFTILQLAVIFALSLGIVAGCSSPETTELPTAASTAATTTKPPTTASTVATSTTVTTAATNTMTTTPSSKILKWGEGFEINSAYATVGKPIELTSAPASEGKRIMIANVQMSSKPGGTWVAYDEQGNAYAPVSVPWGQAAASVGPYTGSLTFEIPSGATVERIVWDWPIFEWVNMLIWE